LRSLLGADSGRIVRLAGRSRWLSDRLLALRPALLAPSSLRLAALEVVAQRRRPAAFGAIFPVLFWALIHADRLRLTPPYGKERRIGWLLNAPRGARSMLP